MGSKAVLYYEVQLRCTLTWCVNFDNLSTSLQYGYVVMEFHISSGNTRGLNLLTVCNTAVRAFFLRHTF